GEAVLAPGCTSRAARASASGAEPLAPLGASLALCRHSLSASGVARGEFDVGAYESERIGLIEVDTEGRRRWTEIFASNQLGTAIARLYERYARLLPAGLARARAVATARSLATIFENLFISGRIGAVLRPDVEFIDHRTLGLGSTRGADAIVRGIDSLYELTSDRATRVDDVVGLRSDALLVRLRDSGTLRVGGGDFERNFLVLWVFGPDGLVTRWEQFDADRDDEALARFDERTARSRIRPNAATANIVRLVAATNARDHDAFADLIAEGIETIDHSTGVTYGREGVFATWRISLDARDFAYRSEPLATLGDSLALCRHSLSASGVAGREFDVGAYESERIGLIEVDTEGRRRWTEIFASNKLGTAIARLYERYAELLPDGPERARAATTARVLSITEPVEPDRF